MSKIKLLPCPFCGTRVTTRDILPVANPVPNITAKCFIIRCWECSAKVFEQTRFKTQIAAKWNKRTQL